MTVQRTLLAAALLLASHHAGAQTTELTSADRLALLYSSQMQFDAAGEPLVKVGIDDGLPRLSFEASGGITVLPSGPGGPAVELEPGRYTVQIRDSTPGAYDHHVVLGVFAPDDVDALRSAEEDWVVRGVETTLIELGSLFAISGQMFDTRQNLLVTGSFRERSQARALEAELEETHGVDLHIRAELTQHPTGTLTLASDDDHVRVTHHDVLWVQLAGEATLLNGNHEGRSYSEFLVFTADREGALALVNTVHVEEVLRGVVPAEIYATAPLESLKAQAVAARGTLVSQIGSRHLADPYNLCDEQHCQVFGGVGAARDTTDQAIEETRGRILFDGKRIAETFYASNCGGVSERPEAVWGSARRSYLHAHDDDGDARVFESPPTEDALRQRLSATPEAWCNTTRYSSGKHFRWSRSFTRDELEGLIAEKHEGLGELRDIQVTERGAGGRVVRLELTGSRDTLVIERELPVRRLFGGLKSGLFVLDVERDDAGQPTRVTFTGGGFGHGVGMCQTGAMGMAHGGHDVDAILDHYYHGSALINVW